MGTVERKEREKENRKESIIDAAQIVFFDKGLHLSTMDEIAEKAELAKGTLYLYYRSKEDLYLAVMMRGLLILHGMIEKVISQKLTVVQTLVDLYAAYEIFYTKNKNYFRMMHFFHTPQFHKQVSGEMMESCDAVNKNVWKLVVDVIQQGMDEKKLRKDLNPVEIAMIMWSNTSTLLMIIDNQYDLFREKLQIDLHNTLRVSNRLFLESILTEQGKKELHAILN